MEFCNTLKLTLLLVAVVGFTACQQLVFVKPKFESEPVADTAQQETAPEPPQPPDKLPPSRRVRKALQLLEQGEYDYARKQLSWALQDKPGLQIAENLIAQIDADPIDYLGVKNFYYRVESGESLSIIAGKFLDDPMKFVVLARYNRLDNPSKLAPGDRIRVPGEMPEQVWKRSKKKKQSRRTKRTTSADKRATERNKPAAKADGQSLGQQAKVPDRERAQPKLSPLATAMPRPQARESQASLDQVLDKAKRLYAMGDLPSAIYQLENDGSRFAKTKAMRTLQIAYNKEYAALLMQQGELQHARSVLEKLILLDASDEKAINDLIRVEDKLEARKLYQQGNEHLASGSAVQAYQSFTQALTYDPDNTLAKQAQMTSRDQVTDDYHRQAMRHFRKQELGKAIVLWDKILDIDPAHTLAPGYKARAVEMRQKLERIEAGR